MGYLMNPYIYGAGSTLADGLISYYKLDGNSEDAVGIRSGVTNTNITYSTGAGIILSGASFNGTNSYIGMGGRWIDTFSSVTVSCWVKVTYGSSYDSFVAQYMADPNGQWFSFNTFNVNGSVQFAVDAGGGALPARQFVTVAASGGAWHHVVGVRDVDSAELRLYVDYNGATGVTTGVYAGDLTCTGTEASLGNIYTKSGYYQGDLDEVGVWNRALTEAEISELYNSGSGNQYPF